MWACVWEQGPSPALQMLARTRWRHLASGPRCPGPSGCPSLRCPAGPRWSRPPVCSHCTWYESKWHIRICMPLHHWLRRCFSEIRASTGLNQKPGGQLLSTRCSDTMAHTHTHVLLVFPKTTTIKIPEQNKSREFYQMLWFPRTSKGLTFQAGTSMPLLEELPCWVFFANCPLQGTSRACAGSTAGAGRGPSPNHGVWSYRYPWPLPHPHPRVAGNPCPAGISPKCVQTLLGVRRPLTAE